MQMQQTNGAFSDGKQVEIFAMHSSKLIENVIKIGLNQIDVNGASDKNQRPMMEMMIVRQPMSRHRKSGCEIYPTSNEG